MRIVKILGGLGNQMFQYAFFLALREKNINHIKVDVSAFSSYTLHQGFELANVFNISDNIICSPGEVNTLKDSRPYFFIRKTMGKLFYSDPNKFIKATHLIESNYAKYESSYIIKQDTYFDGYWQSEKYFNNLKSQIREIYRWRNVNEINLSISGIMQAENSVAIHIRRFDRPRNLKEFYLRFKLLLVWRVCSKTYYLRALKHISEVLENPKYYVFTDNIVWVKKNIPLNDDCVIVDWNRNKESHYDMFLMSKCRHNIISMSSFSWWGAWLNENPDKIVIAPKKWALRFNKDFDLIPSTWKRI